MGDIRFRRTVAFGKGVTNEEAFEATMVPGDSVAPEICKRMTWEDFRHTVIFRGSWAYGPELMKPGCDHKFSTLYEGMLAGGYDEYDLDRVRTAIFYLRNILVRHGLTGPDKVCVEIGCGTGNKALAVQDLFGHYFGVDPQAEQIDTANRRSRDLSMANTTFIAANAVDVLRKPESFGLPQHIDVLMLYAVIEHLTLNSASGYSAPLKGYLLEEAE